MGIEYNMSLDVKNWTRQTYSLLDWLGDLGGLLDVLLHMGRIMVFPVSSFTLKNLLMSSFFRYRFSSSGNKISKADTASKASSNPINFVQTVKKELTAS